MDITTFLQQVVEGYLLHDLESMARVQVPPPGTMGAVYYPMIMTTLAGMELLGALLSPSRFKHKDGDEHFIHFGREYLSKVDSRYGDQHLLKAVRILIRHKLAHAFVMTPGIVLTKGSRDTHLGREQETGSLVLDCIKFYEDLEASYYSSVRPLLATTERRRLQTNLDAMIRDQRNAAKQLLAALPKSNTVILRGASANWSPADESPLFGLSGGGWPANPDDDSV